MAVNSTLINRYGILAVIAIMLSFLTACTETKGTEHAGVNTRVRQLPDSLLTSLQEGDLALRRGRDVASYMISQVGLEDKTYSHCGLVHIENGRPYVYHFVSGVNRQGLVKDPAEQFFSPVDNGVVGVKRYFLTDEQKNVLVTTVSRMNSHNAGFDMSFDVGSTDKLYCSEFVYQVMNKVKEDSTFIRPAMKNGMAYIPIDALYMTGRANDIWQMRFK